MSTCWRSNSQRTSSYALAAISALLLAACSAAPARPGATSPSQDFRAASARCLDLAVRTERVQVPTGNSVTHIDIPIHVDTSRFAGCMEVAGFPPAEIDAQGYLSLALGCLEAARGAPHPDAAYGACVQDRGPSVEVLPGEGSR